MSTVTRAPVERRHLEAAGRIIGENSTYTPDCGRVLYKEAQGDIAQALASAESAAYARGLADGAERERAAVKTWLDDQGEVDLADHIEASMHLEESE